MTIVILSNPKSFVKDAESKNIKLDYINEAIECIGRQAVVRMFVGKSQRGSNGCLSSKSLENWIATFEFVKNNPTAEDKDKFSGARCIEKIDSLWDDYVDLIKRPISEDVVKTWPFLSKPKLGDEAEKHGITLGIRNANAIKTLLERMNKMVERRQRLFWNKTEEVDIVELDEISTKPKVDYRLMNVPALRKLCKQRKIVSNKMKKDDMLEALQTYDSEKGEIIYVEYENMTNDKLKSLCKERKLSNYNKLNKENLIKKLTQSDDDIQKIKSVIEDKSEDENVENFTDELREKVIKDSDEETNTIQTLLGYNDLKYQLEITKAELNLVKKELEELRKSLNA